MSTHVSKGALRWLAMAGAVSLVQAGCGSDGPPQLGQKCDLDAGDGACASDDAVCAEHSEEEEPICQLDVGAPCDENADEPYCLQGTRCDVFPDPEDDEATLALCALAPGEPCEQEDDLCSDGLACVPAPDGELLCGLNLGDSCELSAQDGDRDAGAAEDGGMAAEPEDFCVGEAVCSPFPDPEDETVQVGRCALPLGAECVPDEADFCADGLLCAEKRDGSHACFPPVLLSGTVSDSSDDASLEGAHVIALNDSSEAVSDVAVTDAEGQYVLRVPVVREDDGTPVDDIAFTLRVSAADYQTFPSGIRQAIPILSSEAMREQGEDELDPGAWVIAGTLANVQLIALPDDGQERVTISGSVITTDEDDDGVDDDGRGTLVVAHNDQQPAATAIADLAGDYTIFNVQPGAVSVKGYKAGLQLSPVEVTADADLEDVDLTLTETGPSDVSGTLSIVNAPGGAMTSVVLAVEDTFTEGFGRGEVPAGCRTGLDVTGEWAIEGVPAGRYVVLAAFENDDLVRDPDQNIAGTDTVRIEVTAGEDTNISEAFKVTEALGIVEPGADLPTGVSSAPTLTWRDDSSEDYYTVEVYNALGERVWEQTDVPGVSGSETVTVEYGGPLTEGMYYQFRAKSWRSPGNQDPSPISATEDLRGVFFVQ